MQIERLPIHVKSSGVTFVLGAVATVMLQTLMREQDVGSVAPRHLRYKQRESVETSNICAYLCYAES